jgi:lipid-binding SYLF domain-containing protein
MRSKILAVLVACAFSIVSIPAYAASDTGKWETFVEKGGIVFSEIQQMPDKSIPTDLLEHCVGIAVFPATISGGLGIGGKYGQGIIMTRDVNSGKWSCPAVFTLAGGSIGWQIGGQATDVVLLFMSKSSVEGIIKGKIKLGVDASVAAGPVGRDAEASTSALLGGILSYSRTKGLFAGAKFEGVVITQHWDGNKALYGSALSAEDILLNNKGKMPRSAGKLLEILRAYPYKK